MDLFLVVLSQISVESPYACGMRQMRLHYWNREHGVLNYQYLQSVVDVHHGSMQLRQINLAWKIASKPHSYENIL